MGILDNRANIKLNVNTGLENIEKINSTIKKILNEDTKIPKLLKKLCPDKAIKMSWREIKVYNCEIGFIYELTKDFSENEDILMAQKEGYIRVFTRYLQRYEENELVKLPLSL
jgi:hypothetical protein